MHSRKKSQRFGGADIPGGVEITMYIPKLFFGNQLVEESLCSLREYRDLFLALDSRKRTEPIQPYRRFIACIYRVEKVDLRRRVEAVISTLIR